MLTGLPVLVEPLILVEELVVAHFEADKVLQDDLMLPRQLLSYLVCLLLEDVDGLLYDDWFQILDLLVKGRLTFGYSFTNEFLDHVIVDLSHHRPKALHATTIEPAGTT